MSIVHLYERWGEENISLKTRKYDICVLTLVNSSSSLKKINTFNNE